MKLLGFDKHFPSEAVCIEKFKEIRIKSGIVMGQRDAQYTLSGMIELDEGFFSTERDEEEKTKPLKRGRGSQKKSKVLVMVESEQVANPKNPQKPKQVNHLKIIVVPDLKAGTIELRAKTAIEQDTRISTDGPTSYTNFKDFFCSTQCSCYST